MRCSELATLFACVCGLATSASVAQVYPAKTVRLVAPYPPGGPNDLIARIVAQRMSQTLGQPWIVDNRPGRGGNIGTEIVTKRPRTAEQGPRLRGCDPVAGCQR